MVRVFRAFRYPRTPEATGKKMFPRQWNHDFIDLPVVESTEQARPTLDAEEVAACIANAKDRYRVLYALLAGTGLRIGEALAIHLEDGDHTTISTDCKTIHVRKSVWRGKEQQPKTPAAKRSVDLCESLAAYLRVHRRSNVRLALSIRFRLAVGAKQHSPRLSQQVEC